MAKAKSIVSSKKTILPPSSLEFLKKYLNTPSPVGFESEGQKIWIGYLKPFIDTYFTDAYGTGVGVINPDAKFRVVIEAHADEISWFVNYINPRFDVPEKKWRCGSPGSTWTKGDHPRNERSGEGGLRLASHTYPDGES
jgi:hypothetical protein